ncbi:hypothetical protein B0H10DRAFT_1670231, partial [Mycena sp. CBHHK59/15]
LVVGDYFKSDSNFLMYSKQADALIKWLRSKTYILALIRNVQRDANNHILSVIRAVLTRWTAHYLAYRRLLELRPALESIIAADALRSKSDLIKGDPKAKAKARTMIQVIRNSSFWYALVRMKVFLEPLAVAANVTQSAFCRLDQVLLTLGRLVMQYSALDDLEDANGRDVIIASLEQRWAKSDQDVFIAAVLLNPFFKTGPFAPRQDFAFAGIHQLFAHLWMRFNKTNTAPPDLYATSMAYF